MVYFSRTVVERRVLPNHAIVVLGRFPPDCVAHGPALLSLALVKCPRCSAMSRDCLAGDVWVAKSRVDLDVAPFDSKRQPRVSFV